MINIFIVYNIIGVIHLVALFYKLSSKGGISINILAPMMLNYHMIYYYVIVY
jgi:hypothetical protein